MVCVYMVGCGRENCFAFYARFLVRLPENRSRLRALVSGLFNGTRI